MNVQKVHSQCSRVLLDASPRSKFPQRLPGARYVVKCDRERGIADSQKNPALEFASPGHDEAVSLQQMHSDGAGNGACAAA